MNYYRKTVNNVINSVKLQMQMTAITLKLSENINKINDLLEVDKNIKNDVSSNLTKIGDNETNISSNLTKIGNNEANVSSNLTKIGDNETNISSNLTKIGDNETNISSNLGKINSNKNNIRNNYNISRINEKKSEFNTSLIDNNIESLKSIKNDIVDYYKLKDIIIFDIEKTNISEDISINLPKLVIIQSSLNNIFKKDCYLKFEPSILIFFNKHYINIGFFHMLLEFFDDDKELFKNIKLPIISMVSKHCILNNSCITKLTDNFNSIYLKLSIKLNDNQNRTDSISILDFDNKIYFKYFEK